MSGPRRYSKTASGQAEMHRGRQGLSRPLRNVLLCVDGKRDSADIEPIIQACGAPSDALEQLRALGLIEAVELCAPPQLLEKADATVAQGTPLPARLPHADGPDTLQPLDADSQRGPDAVSGDYATLYGQMTALLSDHLDPLKEYTLQLKIEQCTVVEDLRALLPELEVALVKVLGKIRARELVRAVSAPGT